jgi:uncharacterized membrane protein
MMRTVDQIEIAAPAHRVFAAASDVERWPAILAHYRSVKLVEKGSGTQIVEMSAWRPFGPFNWPTWWTSRMWIDPSRLEVRYRHIRGVTTGMDVVWRILPNGDATKVELVHDWAGPAWPLIGVPAAEWVIGPVFVHGIAARTLAGIKRHTERAG